MVLFDSPAKQLVLQPAGQKFRCLDLGIKLFCTGTLLNISLSWRLVHDDFQPFVLFCLSPVLWHESKNLVKKHVFRNRHNPELLGGWRLNLMNRDWTETQCLISAIQVQIWRSCQRSYSGFTEIRTRCSVCDFSVLLCRSRSPGAINLVFPFTWVKLRLFVPVKYPACNCSAMHGTDRLFPLD